MKKILTLTAVAAFGLFYATVSAQSGMNIGKEAEKMTKSAASDAKDASKKIASEVKESATEKAVEVKEKAEEIGKEKMDAVKSKISEKKNSSESALTDAKEESTEIADNAIKRTEVSTKLLSEEVTEENMTSTQKLAKKEAKLDASINNGDAKVAEAKAKIDAALEKLNLDKAAGKINAADYAAKNEKIQKAMTQATTLEEKLTKAKKLK